MKRKTSLLVLLLATLVIPFIACSPDEIEEKQESKVMEEIDISERPDWMDGIIAIETGRFWKSSSLLAELIRERCKIEKHLYRMLENDIVTMLRLKKTVDVSIVKMTEVGIQEPTEYTKILEKYEEAGYRPLTLEEAIELRVQFKDQMPVSTEITSAFFALLSEESRWEIAIPVLVEGDLVEGKVEMVPQIIGMYAERETHQCVVFSTSARGSVIIDPHVCPRMPGSSVPGGTRFACVKVK